MFAASDTVLEVDRVSKLYARRPKATRARVRSVLVRAMSGLTHQPVSALYKHEFWAVRDVTFTLKRGEALGVIGLNGSGKTTLLRMLAGQILPDDGEIRILGKSAAMIDLTAGFQTGESGWANIFLRGAALGRSHADIAAALDDIVDFAELGDAIHAPVATYSAGMMMRLAFSIMLAATSDILLIDEILAVGDFLFRQKCLAKIREMRDKVAIVLVSHSMADISRFCDRVIVLDKGRIVFQGQPKEAIEMYESLQFTVVATKEQKQTAVLGPEINNNSVLTEVEHYWCDKNGKHVAEVKSGETLCFYLSFRSTVPIRELIVGLPVWTVDGIYATGFSTEISGGPFRQLLVGKHSFRLSVPQLTFNPGDYISSISILDGVEFLWRKPNPSLTVTSSRNRYWGVVTLDHTWHACTSSSETSV